MKELCLVVIAGVFLSVTAFGAPVVCPDVTTVGALESLTADGCVSGDKIYTMFSSNIADNVLVLLIQAEGGPGPDNHGWNVVPSGGFGVGTYTFNYTISVDLANFPAFRISEAQLDAQGGLGAAYTAMKVISGGYPTLNISNTTSQSSTAIDPPATSLTIADTLVVTSGRVFGLSNTFAQLDTTDDTKIPEPMTQALLGTGLLAIGFARRFLRR